MEGNDRVEEAAQEAAVKASSNVPLRARGKARARQLQNQHSYTWRDLPDYLKDNEFIVGSYRNSQSVKDSLFSLFTLHNETGNIWTHLLGFILFACLTVYLCVSPPTPLAFGKEQVDTVWGNVVEQFQHVGVNLHQKIQYVQSNIHTNLHTLQDNIQDTMQHIHDDLGKTVHALQDNLQHRMHDIQSNVEKQVQNLQVSVHSLHDSIPQTLKHNLHSIQDNLHQLREAVNRQQRKLPGNIQQLREVVNRQLHHVLQPILQWPTPRWPAYVYMAGAMICLLTSSICHLLGCCRMHISVWVWKLDYAAISLLIVASFFPSVYYGFLCIPFWRNFYLLTTTSMGVMTVVVSLSEFFQHSKFRVFRACLFAGMGLWGLVPVIHQWYLNSDILYVRKSLAYDVAMGAVYLLGAAVYALRVPERWKPGSFDMLLHSHQIFHIAVVVAAFVHYKAVLILLAWRDASGGCAAPLTGHLQGDSSQHLGVAQVWEGLQQQLYEYLDLVH